MLTVCICKRIGNYGKKVFRKPDWPLLFSDKSLFELIKKRFALTGMTELRKKCYIVDFN